MIEIIKEILGEDKKYYVKFGCDDGCQIVINDKYVFGTNNSKVKTVTIPEKPYKIVAHCWDYGGGYGFKLICTDEKGNVLASTDDIEHWRCSDGSTPMIGTLPYYWGGIYANPIWGRIPNGRCTLIYYNPNNKELLSPEQKKIAIAFTVLVILLAGVYYAHKKGYIKIES
ncbi:hypothetical protein [Methanocaldococcus sp.]